MYDRYQRQCDDYFVDRHAVDPFTGHSWVLPLAGQPSRARIRQGDRRAVVLIARAQDAVVVERIEHGREVYR